MLQAKGKMLGKYPNHYSKKRKKKWSSRISIGYYSRLYIMKGKKAKLKECSPKSPPSPPSHAHPL